MDRDQFTELSGSELRRRLLQRGVDPDRAEQIVRDRDRIVDMDGDEYDLEARDWT